MLDLHRLQILWRFGEDGSINATAAALGYSPSAISQQLSTLERETGVALLERTARSATLTDAGRLLARHAAELISAAERAEADLAAQAGTIGGQLTVSAIPSLATAVAGALAAVQRRHPALEILMRQIATVDAGVAVSAYRSDIAVIDGWSAQPDPPPAGLTRHHICTEPVVLAVPADHPLAGAETPLTARRLAHAATTMTWLCAPEGHLSRRAGDRRLAAAGAEPARRWEFEGLVTIAQLVAEGTGCALLPETIARAQPAERLHRRPLAPAMVRRIGTLTRTSAGTNPTHALCLAAIAEHVTGLAGGR